MEVGSSLPVATSQTHPIYANEVQLPPNIPGKLLLTFAPGKKQVHSQSSINWQRTWIH